MKPSAVSPEKTNDPTDLDWNKFPVEMEKRGWLGSIETRANASAGDIVKAFLSQIASGPGPAKVALYRRNFRGEEMVCIPAIAIADSEHCDHLIRSA